MPGLGLGWSVRVEQAHGTELTLGSAGVEGAWCGDRDSGGTGSERRGSCGHVIIVLNISWEFRHSGQAEREEISLSEATF